MRSTVIDPWPATLPMALGFGITGIALGATGVAMFWNNINAGPTWGTVLGGFVSAGVAVLLWGITYLHTERGKKRSRENLCRALWVEAEAIVDICYREAQWFRSQPNNNIQRTLQHLEAPVLDAHLGSIGDVPDTAAAALLEMRGRLSGVLEVVKIYSQGGASNDYVSNHLMIAAASALMGSKQLEAQDAFPADRTIERGIYSKKRNAEIEVFGDNFDRSFGFTTR